MQDLLAIIHILEQERKLNNVKNEKELHFRIELKNKKKKKKVKAVTAKIIDLLFKSKA